MSVFPYSRALSSDKCLQDGEEVLLPLLRNELRSDGDIEHPFLQFLGYKWIVMQPLAVLFCGNDDGCGEMPCRLLYRMYVAAGEFMVVPESQMAYRLVAAAQIFLQGPVMRTVSSSWNARSGGLPPPIPPLVRHILLL